MGVRKSLAQGLHDDRRRLETERGRVADVQAEDLLAAGFQLGRTLGHRTPQVVEHAVQAR